MIRLYLKIPENFVHRIFRDGFSVVHKPFVRSKLNFLHHSLWITFPTQSCLVLYLLHSHIIHMQPYTYTCGNIFNTIKTSGHSSLEKYTSHFIRKGYERVIVWEVSWRLNKDCNILTPSSSGYSSVSFSFFWTAQPEAQPLLGPGSHSSNCND